MSLAMPVVLTEIRSAALEFRSLEPGEQPVSLAEQLDGIKIQEQYRWRLYKVLSDYPQAFNELRQLIDPVASALEAVFEQLRPLLEPTYDYWQECLERYSISELMRRMTNQDLEVHATDISINVGIMGFREMIWGLVTRRKPATGYALAPSSARTPVLTGEPCLMREFAICSR